VEREIRSKGREMPEIELGRPQQAEKLPDAPSNAQQPKLFTVSQRELEECDTYPLVRFFSVDRQSTEDRPSLKKLRGRFLLVFPSLDEEVRQVWEIPRARAYVRKLFDELPYFPYYLDLRPDFYSLHLFFGCLADGEAMVPLAEEELHSEQLRTLMREVQKVHDLRTRAGLSAAREETTLALDLMHPSVVRPMAVSMLCVRWLCVNIGDDVDFALRDLLKDLPADLAEQVVGRVMAVPERLFRLPLKDFMSL
jgi:hypothetical protein